MAIQVTPMMIRGLKGAPISCLLAFIVMRQVLNTQELVRTTGYSDKSVADALAVLSDFGLITRNGRYGWQLADGVAQLPLAVLSGEEEPEAEPAVVPADQMAIDVLAVEEVSTIVVTEPVTEKGTENFRITSLASGLTRQESSQENYPDLDSRSDPEKLRVNQAYAALEVAGIRDPARSRLAKLPHVTGKLVRYHVQTASSLGLAIYRIEHNWKIRDNWADADAPERFAVQSTGADTQPLDDPEPETVPELPAEAVDAWEKALETIRPTMRAADFDTWLLPLELERVEGAKWVARSKNHYARDWVRDHAVDQLQTALTGLAGTVIVLKLE